ncbi:uncharacterized protein [Amphiura filiformis]|uniref:uncharacterized protein n=1 Tax=Amphiura filiformis TaxID=82378 RepID=UPI003B21422A
MEEVCTGMSMDMIEEGIYYFHEEDLSVTSSHDEEDASGREYSLKPIVEWDEDDVLEWLGDVGLDYFVDMFQDCGIDGEYIISVTDEDLAELEVDDAELRQCLLRAVNEAAEGHFNKITISDTAASSNQRIPYDENQDNPPSSRKRVDSVSESQDPSDVEFSDFDLPDDGDDLAETTSPNVKPKILLTAPSVDVESNDSLMENESYNVDEDDSEEVGKDDSELLRTDEELVDGEDLTDDDEEPLDDHYGNMGWHGDTDAPVVEWEESQVLQWLSAVGLGHLRTHFQGHNLTGNKLLNIDMQFLDEMQVTSKDDREQLLSHLYQLNNPDANINLNDTISAINQISGYERQKYIAAVAVLQSQDPEGAVQVIPADSAPTMEALEENPASREGSRENSPRYASPRTHVQESTELATNTNTKSHDSDKLNTPDNSIYATPPSREIKLKSTPSSGSEGSKRSDGEDRKKKTGIMKLVGAISPKVGRKQQKNEATVQIWPKIGLKGSSSSIPVKLKNDTNTEYVIKECLATLKLMEDFRLYTIWEVIPASTKGLEGDDRELEYDEFPLEVQYMWPDHVAGRWELRPRLAQGGSVKLVYHQNGQKPKGKLLSISLSTPAYEVVTLGLQKFGVQNSDPDQFCLLEVDKFGDLHDVDDDAIPLQLDSHAFVLCDRFSKDTVASKDDDGTSIADVKRNDSQVSRTSSKVSFSGVSLTSSHGSGSDILSSRIDDEKLSKLEEEHTIDAHNYMASIAEALSPRGPSIKQTDPEIRQTRTDTETRQTRQPEEQDSSDGKDEKVKAQLDEHTDVIQSLRQQNKRLEEKAKQLLVVQSALSRLENTYKHEIAESHKRVAGPCESDNLPESVVELKRDLEKANQDITKKRQNVEKLKQEQQKQDNIQDNLDSSIQAAELDYKIALEETALVALQQDQARLFCKLELALADHQVAVEKAKSRRYCRPLYPVLSPPSMQCNTVILPLNIDLAQESQGLQLADSKDQRGVVVERCQSQGTLKVGDRLFEVNGENVSKSDIAEVNSYLNKSAKARVVILRDQPIIEDNTANLAKMKQQLSLVSQQLESSRRENKNLKEEVRRYELLTLLGCPLETQVIETTQMKASIQQLQNELASSQNRSEQLAVELVASRNSLDRDTQREKVRLEEEVDDLKETVFRLQESMEAKDAKLASVIHERDAALERSRETTTDHNDSKPKQSAMIIGNEDDLPLWESLKSANKSEILEVLREEVEEAGRQKNYLDQLYTLMLEKAPELLNQLESECEISELSDNGEEFC